jgi:hypothetical protein
VADLIEEYRVHLRNPSIVLTPLRRVHVLGEVNHRVSTAWIRPFRSRGRSPWQEVLTQSATSTASESCGTEARCGGACLGHFNGGMMGIRSGDQILVDRRGWFERNSTFVVSALLSVTSIVISLAR